MGWVTDQHHSNLSCVGLSWAVTKIVPFSRKQFFLKRPVYKLEETSMIQMDPQWSWGIQKCPLGSLSTGWVPQDQNGSKNFPRGPHMSWGILINWKGFRRVQKGSTSVLWDQYKLKGSSMIKRDPQGSWGVHKRPEGSLIPYQLEGSTWSRWVQKDHEGTTSGPRVTYQLEGSPGSGGIHKGLDGSTSVQRDPFKLEGSSQRVLVQTQAKVQVQAQTSLSLKHSGLFRLKTDRFWSRRHACATVDAVVSVAGHC